MASPQNVVRLRFHKDTKQVKVGKKTPKVFAPDEWKPATDFPNFDHMAWTFRI